MKQFLKSKQLRVTQFRLTVLGVFEKYQNAISTEQIEKELGDFDRITLYRTLKTFKEKGIIHEIVMPGGTKTMALCAEECHESDHQHHHEHVHFRCKECKNIFCLDINGYPHLDLPGFKIDQMEIQAFGTCETCSCVQ
ncbi:MAG: transcriptional repressor [Crocinitomicaceae bacterium]